MKHVTARLQAYYDDELDPRTAKAVAAHLAECEACLAEFEALEMLSALLFEVPVATHPMPEDRFVSQVTLRLPREKATTMPERTLKWGWRLAPAVLVATWVFVQAAAILTSGIAALLHFGVGGEAVGALIPEQTAAGGAGLGLAGSLLDALGGDAAAGILRQLSIVGSITIVPMLFTGLTALAICSWIAMWWATQQQSNDQLGKL